MHILHKIFPFVLSHLEYCSGKHHCHYAGLGNTVKEIDISDAKVFSKTVFSMVIPEVEEVIKQDSNRKSVVLFGIEVCY